MLQEEDEKKSIGSTSSSFSQINNLQFNSLEDPLFKFFSGYRWDSNELPNSITIALQIIVAWQWFMVPLRNSRISSFGFHHILIILGLYIDPSNYISDQPHIIIGITVIQAIMDLFWILTFVMG
ncbi:MAG: hypothetical protein EZS28_041346, partial [Streblomastix strix]